nr:hypothetical protein B0A51_17102 [Rachicladosporium sp. CCFEE 5018]
MAVMNKRAAVDDVAPQGPRKQRKVIIDDLDFEMEDKPANAKGSVDEGYRSGSSTVRSIEEDAHSVANTLATRTTSGKSQRAKVFACDWEGCGRMFDRPARVEIHMRGAHTKEKPFLCPEVGCDKRFFRKEHLAAHTKAKHEDARDHICDYIIKDGDECGKSFHTAQKLKKHVAMHEEKEDKTCADCGQVFRKQETLQRHIKSAHLDEPAYRCTHVDANESGHMLQEDCGQSFKTVNALNRHMNRDHSGPKHFCEICAPNSQIDAMVDSASKDNAIIGFSTHAELQHHIKLIHPPTCHDCGQPCESNRALKAHLEIYHTPANLRANIACLEASCPRKFTKNGNMKVHYQSVHVKVRLFVCGQYDLSRSMHVPGWDGAGCGSAMNSKATLEEHVRVQHLLLPRKGTSVQTGKQRGKANGATTPATTVKASLLTGQGYDEHRPIACHVAGCPKRFMREYDLATHLELSHGWNIDDVNDFMAERDAKAGGDFWIGGAEVLEDDADQELRARLLEGLQLGVPVGNMAGGLAIDPALGGWVA